MLLLLFAMTFRNHQLAQTMEGAQKAYASPSAEQVQHEQTVTAMYSRFQLAKKAVEEMGLPAPSVVANYYRARLCIERFHRYKATTCAAELAHFSNDAKAAGMKAR